MRRQNRLPAPVLCVPGFPLVCSESENELPKIATIYLLFFEAKVTAITGMIIN
jgi:hypothetical protein